MEMGSTIRGIVRLAVYLAVTMVAIPVQALLVWRNWDLRTRFPTAYHRLCMRILGIQVVQVGAPSTTRPTLFVSNHSSYMDIPVLGSLLPVSFVAKAEVAGWPFFGLLANLQQTVYVDRQSRTRTQEQRDSIAGRLQAGDNLVLFPEGTSSDGNRTLPFKTALFSVASVRVPGPDGTDRPLTVQPVSVTATHLDGIPLGHVWRSLYAWYGDMELPPHLWTLVRAGRIRVVVEFHPPVSLDGLSSRKALADHCWRAVATGVDRAVRGQPPARPANIQTPSAPTGPAVEAVAG